MRILIPVVLALTLASLGLAQDCPNGLCPFPTKTVKVTTPQVSENARYQWEKNANPDMYLLRRDGKIIGQYYIPDMAYYPWDGKGSTQANNGPATKPPIDPPTGRAFVADAQPMAEWQIAGVRLSPKQNEVITFGGKVIQPHMMEDAFAGKLDDDSTKGYMIIIAKDEAKRNKVLADYMKLPESFRSRYHLWMADPNHFTMQDRYNGKPRFPVDGDPSVVLQNSTGEVLFRRPRNGAVYQQGDMQDLLKSDPNYVKDNDPGVPAKTPSDYIPKLSAQTWSYVGFGAVSILFLLKRRKS